MAFVLSLGERMHSINNITNRMNLKGLPALLMACFLFCFSCNNKKEGNAALFELVDNTGIHFNNKVIDQEYDNSFLFRNFYNGGGVAIGDINNDGLVDVLL